MAASEKPCAVHEMAWCSLCDPATKHKPVPRDPITATEAEFAGRCACCDDYYPSGTLIAYSEADSGWAIANHIGTVLPISPVRNLVDFTDLLEP